jgi:MoaA/NifB/PqqE/SkfB family radical SAM enzyme
MTLKSPTFLQVELTNHCNLNCAMCSRGKQLRKLGHMEPELALKIIRQSAQFAYPLIWFHAFGEPLLYPYLEEVLKYFRQSGYGAGGISTNGLLLDEHRRRLLVRYCRKVLVALDTTREEVYKQLRVNDHFAMVKENLRLLIEEARGTELKIGVQCLRTRLNQDETLEDFERTFGRHDQVTYIYKRTVQYPRGRDFTSTEYQCLEKRRCDWPYWQMSVLYDGNCSLCCWDYDAEQSVGDVRETSLRDIWNGETAANLRSRLAAGELSTLPLCRACGGPHAQKPDTPDLF